MNFVSVAFFFVFFTLCDDKVRYSVFGDNTIFIIEKLMMITDGLTV